MNKINCSKLKMIKANKQILSTIQFDVVIMILMNSY